MTLQKTVRALLDSRWASYLLLCALFWIAAAASFSGFAGKWGLRDGVAESGVEKMLEGTANRPFVYRRLIPMVANLAGNVTPHGVQQLVTERIRPNETFARATSASISGVKFRYTVVYYATFTFIFLSLFVLRSVALHLGCGKLSATFAPVSLMLALPYLQTIGGYFYDGAEIFFFGLASLLALRGNVLLLFALVVPATVNKETFLFFIPSLFPLLRTRFEFRRSIGISLSLILMSGAINAVAKYAFYDNPGSVALYQLHKNLSVYFLPSTYRHYETTYGIVGPSGMSIATLAVVAIVVFRAWVHCVPSIKRHILIALAINIPLFVIFSAAGELRNLSLLFVGLVIMIAHAMGRYAELGANTSGEIPVTRANSLASEGAEN